MGQITRKAQHSSTVSLTEQEQTSSYAAGRCFMGYLFFWTEEPPEKHRLWSLRKFQVEEKKKLKKNSKNHKNLNKLLFSEDSSPVWQQSEAQAKFLLWHLRFKADFPRGWNKQGKKWKVEWVEQEWKMINRNHQGSQCCVAYPQLVLWPLTRDLQAETAANEAA